MIINSRVANFEILYLSFFIGLFLSFSLFISLEKISLRPWLRKKNNSEVFLEKREKVIQGSQSLVLVFVKSVPRLSFILPVLRLNLQLIQQYSRLLQDKISTIEGGSSSFIVHAAAFRFNTEFHSYAVSYGILSSLIHFCHHVEFESAGNFSLPIQNIT